MQIWFYKNRDILISVHLLRSYCEIMGSIGLYWCITLLLSFSVISYGFNHCERNTMQLCQSNPKRPDLFIVDCLNAGLMTVPKSIPTKTTHLYSDNNMIKILENGSFHHKDMGLPKLVKLNIKNNTLKEIQSATHTLSMV